MDSVRIALSGVGAQQRYRLLASLFDELARAGDAVVGGAGSEHLKALSKKIQTLGEECANLEDLLATTKADLAQKAALLDAEQVRSGEQERVLEEQRARLDALQSERAEMEAELVARANALHKAEVDNEQLLVQAQRAQARAADQSRVERAETGKQEQAAEAEELRERLEQHRLDKEAEIEGLKGELNRARAAASQSAETLLAELWQKLAKAKPSLCLGRSQGREFRKCPCLLRVGWKCPVHLLWRLGKRPLGSLGQRRGGRERRRLCRPDRRCRLGRQQWRQVRQRAGILRL